MYRREPQAWSLARKACPRCDACPNATSETATDLRTLYRFDPALLAWSVVPALADTAPWYREGFGMAGAAGRLYIFGGYTPG